MLTRQAKMGPKALLCELQDATGAIVRQEGAYGKEHGRR